MGDKGIVASTAALAILLNEGIGDTIRVSLTPEPGGERGARGGGRAAGPPVDGPALVHAPGLRVPGLRPDDVDVLPGDGPRHPGHLRDRMPAWRETHPGVEELRVAVMGCVVNGPGESKHADIGISLPGTFEEPVAPVFVDGSSIARCAATASSRSSRRSSRTTSTGAIRRSPRGSRRSRSRSRPDRPPTEHPAPNATRRGRFPFVMRVGASPSERPRCVRRGVARAPARSARGPRSGCRPADHARGARSSTG